MKYDINDYNNFDKIYIYATDAKSKDLTSSYEKLGWNLVSATGNKRYSNIMDLAFIRPHKIENKDKLQFFQVNMEIIYNNIGKLEKNKHSKSLISSLSLLLFGISLLATGIYLSLQNVSLLLKIGFIILSAIGTFTILSSIFITKRIYVKEKIYYNKKMEELNTNLHSIFKEIDNLKIKGVKNDNKT